MNIDSSSTHAISTVHLWFGARRRPSLRRLLAICLQCMTGLRPFSWAVTSAYWHLIGVVGCLSALPLLVEPGEPCVAFQRRRRRAFRGAARAGARRRTAGSAASGVRQLSLLETADPGDRRRRTAPRSVRRIVVVAVFSVVDVADFAAAVVVVSSAGGHDGRRRQLPIVGSAFTVDGVDLLADGRRRRRRQESGPRSRGSPFARVSRLVQRVQLLEAPRRGARPQQHLVTGRTRNILEMA